MVAVLRAETFAKVEEAPSQAWSGWATPNPPPPPLDPFDCCVACTHCRSELLAACGIGCGGELIAQPPTSACAGFAAALAQSVSASCASRNCTAEALAPSADALSNRANESFNETFCILRNDSDAYANLVQPLFGEEIGGEVFGSALAGVFGGALDGAFDPTSSNSGDGDSAADAGYGAARRRLDAPSEAGARALASRAAGEGVLGGMSPLLFCG